MRRVIIKITAVTAAACIVMFPNSVAGAGIISAGEVRDVVELTTKDGDICPEKIDPDKNDPEKNDPEEITDGRPDRKEAPAELTEECDVVPEIVTVNEHVEETDTVGEDIAEIYEMEDSYETEGSYETDPVFEDSTGDITETAPASEELSTAASDLDADGASAAAVELYVAGFNKNSDNEYGKVYTSVTSSSGSATVYTNASADYYEIGSENTDVNTWSISDTSILKITKNATNCAYLKPLKAGTTTVTATSSASYGSVKGTCRITVRDGIAPRSVSPSLSTFTINKGENKSVSFTWDPSDCTYRDVNMKAVSGSDCISWYYDNATKAVFKAKKGGTAKVDYYDGFTATRRGTITINILVPVTGVYLNLDAVTLTPGATKQLTTTIAPKDASDTSVTYSSSATGVATVSSTGLITGRSPGTATITARSGDGSKTATCTVTVEKIAVAAVVLNNTTDAAINVGETVTRTATVTPANATYPAVTWESANTAIASVSNGTVTGKAVGSTMITAKADGKTASFKVNVNSPVTGVTLDRSSMSIVMGTTQTLKATVLPADAPNRSVTWTSSYPSIASVDQNGEVTAISPGKTNITATTVDGTKKAVCEVTVLPVSVTNVSLNKDEATVYPGHTLVLTATVYPDNATDRSVRWSSSSADTVSVSSDGLVRGVKLGTAYITASTNDGNRTASCRVTVIPVPASQILLNKDEANLVVGQSKVLIPTVLPEDTTDKTVTYWSSDPNVVTVDNDGLMTGSGVGFAIITATTVSEHRTATCEVIVTSSGVNSTISYDTNADGSAAVTGSEGDNGGDLVIPGTVRGKSVTTIAERAFAGMSGVDGRLVIPGSVTYIGADAFDGMYSVSVVENNSGREVPASSFISESEKSDICLQDGKGNKFYRHDNIGKGTYYRHYLVKELYLDREKVSVEKGHTLRLSATVLPERASDRKVVWQSSDDATAVVSDNGTVTGIRNGKVKIKAISTDSGLSDECEVTVYSISGETDTTPTPVPTKIPEPTKVPLPTKTPSPSPTPTVTPAPVRVIEVTGIKLNKKKATLQKGKTLKLTAAVSPANATYRTVTWKTSNKNIATVDKTGKVKGKKKGTATITASTKNGMTYKCKVTVKETVKVKSIKLNKKKATVRPGKTVKLKVTFNPKKPSNRKITWKSSNKKIATVDKNGKVKGIRKGKATITAISKDGKKKAECKVTVR